MPELTQQLTFLEEPEAPVGKSVKEPVRRKGRGRKDFSGIRVDELPELLKEIHTLIGMRDTMRLVDAFGGTALYIPEKAHAATRVVALIGITSARLLSGRYGGDRVYIPVSPSLSIRDARIRADYDRGESAPIIATREGLSLRQVRNVLNHSRG